jgi:hypothetical protein
MIHDEFDDMRSEEIPDDLVEALIRGTSEAELPAHLWLVGQVCRAAHGPMPRERRARETEVIEAMLVAMNFAPVRIAHSSTRRRRQVLLAVTAAASVLGVGGVAAAAGNLPTPIQSFVHESLSHVGVTVPPTEDTPAPPEPDRTESAGAPGPIQPEATPGGPENAPAQPSGAPDATPGQSGATPGRSGSEAPSQSGATSGHSVTATDQSGAAPAQPGSEAPGQSGSAPGRSATAPGQSDKKSDGSAKKPGESKKKAGQSEK